MSLHQDRDEDDFGASDRSVSLGRPAIFLFGGLQRSGKPRRFQLGAWRRRGRGGPSRLSFTAGHPCRRRARPHGPAAFKPDLPQGALSPLPIKARSVSMFGSQGASWSDTGTTADASTNRTGAYFAVLQLVFTLG